MATFTCLLGKWTSSGRKKYQAPFDQIRILDFKIYEAPEFPKNKTKNVSTSLATKIQKPTNGSEPTVSANPLDIMGVSFQSGLPHCEIRSVQAEHSAETNLSQNRLDKVWDVVFSKKQEMTP